MKKMRRRLQRSVRVRWSMPRGPELSHSSAAQFTRARAAVNLFLHDASQSDGHEVAIATIAPLDETRIILGPPYEHTSHQGAVRSQPHHRLRDLLDAQQSRWYGAFDALGTSQRFPVSPHLVRCDPAATAGPRNG